MIAIALALLQKLAGGAFSLLEKVPWWVWLAIAVLFVGVAYGELRYSDGVETTRADYEIQLKEQGEQAAQFMAEQEHEHRKREQDLADENLHNLAQHAQELQAVEARAAGTAAGLRAGTVQLRQHWQACLRKLPAPGQATDDSGDADAAADLRAADIGRIQRIAGTCDAEVKWWQATWSAAEKAINGP